MRFKLLVLDVDGTILNSKRELSKRTVATLVKIQQLGVRVALASGRPTHALMPIAEALKLNEYKGYIISHNGALCTEAESGNVLFERRIDPQMVPHIEKIAQRTGLVLSYYNAGEVISTDITNPHVQDEAAMNGMTLRQDDMISINMDQWPCELMLVSDDEELLKGVDDYLQRHLSGVMDTIHSNPYYLEIVGYQVGKSYAMSVLVQKMGISMSEVLAIGDGTADVGMIQQAGVGVAMGNATQGVKQCADFTTLTNDQDGAAVAIERAINESDLGLNPSNDGMIIRLPIPMLTEERRREFVKQCKDYAEHARVGIRKARQDANARIDKAKKASEISEDDAARAKEKVQKLTDKNIATVDELFKKKESDLMTV